ncbi:MAG: hypothetical protein HQ522_01530 [Bacteroidetes bacterium]|nr:hypothetical protein [Bacteroidota bacterium]
MKSNKLLQLIFIFIFGAGQLIAQNINTYFESQQTAPFQKLYLHTDREFYFTGDTLWFSCYLLEGQTHIPILGDQNLHVDLIDSSGKLVISEMYPIYDGFSKGNIQFNNDINPGSYVIRANTNYLINFGEDSFFYKPITIDSTKNSFELQNEIQTEFSKNQNQVEIDFLPEGGILLENTLNVISVKITDNNGKGINTSGVVIDGNGNPIAGFKTIYKGMGKFNFYPNSGEKYKAVLSEFPELNYSFSNIKKSGIKIQVSEKESGLIDVGIYSNAGSLIHLKYTLACMHRGKALFYKEFILDKNVNIIRLKKESFGDGINRIVLFDKNFNPVSERLVFSNNYKLNILKVTLSDSVYSTRSKVKLHFSKGENVLNNESSNFSVAVINEKSINAFGETQNILSWLLLDSELNGFIESPIDFFHNDEKTLSDQKLDLLMLTHGWSNYVWNQIQEMNGSQLLYEVTAGINISGYVKQLWRKKHIKNSEIILCSHNDSLFTFMEKSDANGRFNFKNLYLSDPALITLQAKTAGNKQNTEIILNSVEFNKLNPDLERLNNLTSEYRMPIELYRQNYLASLYEKEYEMVKGVIMLDEVEVKGTFSEKPEVKITQIYSEPDITIQLTEKDHSYTELSDLLFAKAPTMFRSGPPGSISSGSGILYVMDGIPCEGIPPVPIFAVERVDIIKRNNTTGMSIYGTRGAGGVVCIYTKKGHYSEVRDKYIKGLISQKIKGFSKNREFYSPKYTPENINSEKPDYRTTLYWNPKVTLENGKAEVSFFTCDNISRYKIFVEGITEKGRICLGSGEFEVNSFNKMNDH